MTVQDSYGNVVQRMGYCRPVGRPLISFGPNVPEQSLIGHRCRLYLAGAVIIDNQVIPPFLSPFWSRAITVKAQWHIGRAQGVHGR